MSEGGRTPVKHAPTLEEMKDKRLEKASELRMRKRDHRIRQRRKISMNNDDEDDEDEEGRLSSPSSTPFVPSSSASSSASRLPPRPLSDFRQDLYSDDPVRVAGACTQFRMRLSGLDQQKHQTSNIKHQTSSIIRDPKSTDGMRERVCGPKQQRKIPQSRRS